MKTLRETEFTFVNVTNSGGNALVQQDLGYRSVRSNLGTTTCHYLADVKITDEIGAHRIVPSRTIRTPSPFANPLDLGGEKQTTVVLLQRINTRARQLARRHRSLSR